MTEADVEKLRVLTQLVLAEHVKHFDAAGHGGADEEFVSFGCEFDALASALGVESVEKPRRIGGNVEYNDAVVVAVPRRFSKEGRQGSRSKHEETGNVANVRLQ